MDITKQVQTGLPFQACDFPHSSNTWCIYTMFETLFPLSLYVHLVSCIHRLHNSLHASGDLTRIRIKAAKKGGPPLFLEQVLFDVVR